MTLDQYVGREAAELIMQIVPRLVLAAFLGGFIGLEREVSGKPAGLRTQMFICVGAAFFTILSTQLASHWGGDHTRIAAQIIPGIGFIGAGSILHSRGSVTGLTTAATLFVVASIGMAAGGGLYLPAVFAAILVLVALRLLGWMETRLRLKAMAQTYEALGSDTDTVLNTINRILADEDLIMQTVQVSRTNHASRVQFTIEANRTEHEVLLSLMRRAPELQSVNSLGPAERE